LSWTRVAALSLLLPGHAVKSSSACLEERQVRAAGEHGKQSRLRRVLGGVWTKLRPLRAPSLRDGQFREDLFFRLERTDDISSRTARNVPLDILARSPTALLEGVRPAALATAGPGTVFAEPLRRMLVCPTAGPGKRCGELKNCKSKRRTRFPPTASTTNAGRFSRVRANPRRPARGSIRFGLRSKRLNAKPSPRPTLRCHALTKSARAPQFLGISRKDLAGTKRKKYGLN